MIAVMCSAVFFDEISPRAGFNPFGDSLVAIADIGTSIIIYLVC